LAPHLYAWFYPDPFRFGRVITAKSCRVKQTDGGDFFEVSSSGFPHYFRVRLINKLFVISVVFVAYVPSRIFE